jgi:phage terminase small subunit
MSADPAANPLQNAKHEAVLQAYFADPSRVGWKAYVAVYPRSSEAAAKTAFSRLLKNAEFSGRCAFLDAAITEKVVDDSVMSAREVLQELSKLGRASIQNVIVRGDDTSDVVESLLELPPEHAATIQELTVETYVEGGGETAREVKRVKVKLHDKRGPLRDLAQHHKLLTEKHEHADPDGRAAGTGAAEKLGEKLTELEVARRLAYLLSRGEKAKDAKSDAKSDAKPDAKAGAKAAKEKP